MKLGETLCYSVVSLFKPQLLQSGLHIGMAHE